MYIMPSTPLTCSSMGAATVSRTVSALAPGYTAVTTTVGGVTSGYWAIGRLNTATAPARVMTMDSTDAKIGRSMKKREITTAVLGWGRHSCLPLEAMQECPPHSSPPPDSDLPPHGRDGDREHHPGGPADRRGPRQGAYTQPSQEEPRRRPAQAADERPAGVAGQRRG